MKEELLTKSKIYLTMALNKIVSKRAYIISILFTIAGLYIVYFGTHTFFTQPENIFREDQQKVIQGTLTEDIMILALQKVCNFTDIHLKEYPDFTFRLSGAAFKSTVNRDKLAKEAKIGDRINISIDDLDYLVKLIDFQLISVGPEYLIDYNIIYVYGINYQGETYLSLESYNAKAESERKTSMVLSVLFGIPLFTAGILMMRRLKKKVQTS